jgi:predicted DNA-binding ribbon-helix-helix protein
MPSAIFKRSVAVSGHRTSVTLEEEFWREPQDIAHARHITLMWLVGEIDVNRRYANLSSQIRTYVFDYYRSQAPVVMLTAADPADAARLAFDARASLRSALLNRQIRPAGPFRPGAVVDSARCLTQRIETESKDRR